MKKQFLFIGLMGLILVAGCVPAKKFNDLKTDFQKAKQENRSLTNALEDCKDRAEDMASAKAKLAAKKQELLTDKQDLEREKTALQEKYDHLKQSYDALEANSSSALAANAKQNRALLSEIEEKQDKLNAEKARLQKLREDLDARGERIDQLENAISAKEQQMKTLKDNISAALTEFEGDGLTVHRKNGKVYVSMENKLLFDSGSWAVNAKGRKAIKQLGEVLAKNPKIHVLIEGHTDNVPYNGRGALKDNWDLSTKRATSVVRIMLENKAINPKQLTAAGRSKYVPVASNDTATGRAKNRRIEVILTPELDKLTELLKG